jgi:hypothetical protein
MSIAARGMMFLAPEQEAPASRPPTAKPHRDDPESVNRLLANARAKTGKPQRER